MAQKLPNTDIHPSDKGGTSVITTSTLISIAGIGRLLVLKMHAEALRTIYTLKLYSTLRQSLLLPVALFWPIQNLNLASHDSAGEITLGDEALTPDSSRFWDQCSWATGGTVPSFDKQFVRDYLVASVRLG